jgi:hypothetical protein
MGRRVVIAVLIASMGVVSSTTRGSASMSVEIGRLAKTSGPKRLANIDRKLTLSISPNLVGGWSPTRSTMAKAGGALLSENF